VYSTSQRNDRED